MRTRDLEAFTHGIYDILVVGGGIYGLAIAAEAARRKLRVALVDAGDFAAATSFNHQKIAHGGLRWLQSGRLDRARESIRCDGSSSRGPQSCQTFVWRPQRPDSLTGH